MGEDAGGAEEVASPEAIGAHIGAADIKVVDPTNILLWVTNTKVSQVIAIMAMPTSPLIYRQS